MTGLVALCAQPALADDDRAWSTAVVEAHEKAEALEADPECLRLRHCHDRVIKAWEQAVRLADTADRRLIARRGEAEAWARLAHWSGLAKDERRAEGLRRSLEDEVYRVSKAIAKRLSAASDKPVPPSAPQVRTAMLAAIVEDVRAAYPDVDVSRARRQRRGSARPALTVVIDPGHGGKDQGASGLRGTKEKDVNLALAQQLGRALEDRLGAKVIFTRSRDRFVTLSRRVRIANDSDADLFVSLHANAHRLGTVRGVETYFARGAPRSGSPRLAKLVQARVIRSVRRRHSGIRNLGTKAAGFRVLKGTRMPAILIEAGFLTHPTEARRLQSVSYRRDVVNGITQGVERFFADRTQPNPRSVAGLSDRRAQLIRPSASEG